ncbi:MAG: exosortase E/protease, VPEID-CTERM system [Myxococcales bacterium]|nr:exosortase E/protease, VPEID-CTERM system [Myxococcales bacterium]
MLDADSLIPAGPLRRPLVVLAVLLGEYMVISYLFDAQPLLAKPGIAAGIAHLGTAAPLLLVVATATLVVGGRRVLAELGSILSSHGRPHAPVAMAVIHAASFPLVLYLTGLVTHPSARLRTELVGAWMLSATTMLLSAVFIAVPWHAVGSIARSLWRPLSAGLIAGVLAFLAGLFSAELWGLLSEWTMHLVAFLLARFSDRLVFVPEEAIVGTETFYVLISPECSGYEGIGLITVFLSAYLWVERRNLVFPRAYLLLPLAITAVWIGNAVRIVLLIGVGIWMSPGVALGGFHSKAGWLLFCAIGLGAVAVARRTGYFAAEPQKTSSPELTAPHAQPTENERGDTEGWPARKRPRRLDNPTATYLMPLLVLLATKLITGLFVVDFDAPYPLGVITVAVTLFVNRKALPRPSWPPSWHAPAVGLLLYPVWLWASPDPGASAADAAAALRQGLSEMNTGERVGWLAFRVTGSCITVPIAEELAFRGYLLRRLIAPNFEEVDFKRWTPVAVLGSSLAFGALHQAYVAGMIAGLAFAIAQRARGRLSDAIVAHMVVNALIATDVLVRDSYYLWG